MEQQTRRKIPASANCRSATDQSHGSLPIGRSFRKQLQQSPNNDPDLTSCDGCSSFHSSGTKTATRRPPSTPEILKLPTGPAASNAPSMCSAPPAVPEPVTARSATSDMSLPLAQVTVPFTITSIVKEQFLRLVVSFPLASTLLSKVPARRPTPLPPAAPPPIAPSVLRLTASSAVATATVTTLRS